MNNTSTYTKILENLQFLKSKGDLLNSYQGKRKLWKCHKNRKNIGKSRAFRRLEILNCICELWGKWAFTNCLHKWSKKVKNSYWHWKRSCYTTIKRKVKESQSQKTIESQKRNNDWKQNLIWHENSNINRKEAVKGENIRHDRRFYKGFI